MLAIIFGGFMGAALSTGNLGAAAVFLLLAIACERACRV